MSSPPPSAPRAQYTNALEFERKRRARHRRRLNFVIGSRLGSLVLLAVAAYEGCSRLGVYALLALACLGIFVALTIAIALLEAWMEKQDARVRYFEEGLQRLDGNHSKDGPDGEPFASPGHPYAVDLDIFGKGSLFQRLCAARTGTGQATLARWLSSAASIPEITERQEAIQELRDKTDLRKELWIAGGMIRGNVREDALSAWLDSPTATVKTSERWLVAGIGLLGMGILYAFVFPSYLPHALVIFLVQRLAVRRYRERVQTVSASAYQRSHELRVMAKVAELLVAENFTSPYLSRLRASVATAGGMNKKTVATLIRRIDWLESRRNPVFGLFATILLFTEQLSFSIEAWRARHASAAKAWLATLAEVEALCSFASFAFEHPGYAFPTVMEEAPGMPRFSASGLGHPLIPPTTRIANDVVLSPDCRMLVVTGSNMSGKSTLLRTVGVNTVLALAGAPTCASALTLTPVRVGASLRARDSLEEGVSRFFAEIQRLHAIVAMAKEGPTVLFLLDEILNGTNSQDRHDGASAVMRLLLDHGAIGLVTTHDLSLASFGEGQAFPARNVHFQDRLEDNRLIFDYRMREGVVTRRNALDLMRLVGIEIGG